MILNWQLSGWKSLSIHFPNPPHALLLAGRPGIGKSFLAYTFSQALLCQEPGETDYLPCGHCQSCTWFMQGNHPDYRLIRPDSMTPESEVESAKKEKKKSEQIRVDQIRDLEGFLVVGSHRGGMRIVVLDPANTLNPIAQNALLKRLEEPSPGTLFILVTSHPKQLLATVRSRCQRLAILPPSKESALLWLKEQGIQDPESALAASAGAPLAALKEKASHDQNDSLLNYIDNQDVNVLLLAQWCESIEPAVFCGWIQRWVYDLLQMKTAGTLRYHPARKDSILKLSKCPNAGALAGLLGRLAQARALADHPLNPRLFYESVLVDYLRTVLPKKA